jgi:hypothetical protein
MRNRLAQSSAPAELAPERIAHEYKLSCRPNPYFHNYLSLLALEAKIKYLREIENPDNPILKGLSEIITRPTWLARLTVNRAVERFCTKRPPYNYDEDHRNRLRKCLLDAIRTVGIADGVIRVELHEVENLALLEKMPWNERRFKEMNRDFRNIRCHYPEAIKEHDQNISFCIKNYNEKGFLTLELMHSFHNTWQMVYENYWKHVLGIGKN